MKIAVLGARGMLGSMLVDYLKKYFRVVALARNGGYRSSHPNVEVRYLDVLKGDDEDLAKVVEGCQWVINAIGLIPQRDKSPIKLSLTNHFYPGRLALIASRRGFQVIQIATDCVFSGEKGGCTELDTPDPVDPYGTSKLQGEIKDPHMHHIRCSIVGREYHGKSLLGWFLSQPEGAVIDGYTNQLWNGVTTLRFAKICQGIIENDISLSHMQHLVPSDTVSKYVLLRYFKKYFNRPDINIRSSQAPDSIDRTLATTYKYANQQLWQLAGYPQPPTIAEMVKELAENVWL